MILLLQHFTLFYFVVSFCTAILLRKEVLDILQYEEFDNWKGRAFCLIAIFFVSFSWPYMIKDFVENHL